MMKVFLAGLAWAGCCTVAQAADAAFAEDGKSVYAVSEAGLERIDLTSGEISKIDPEGVDGVDAICRAGGGAYYLLSEDTLWRWKPDAGPAVSFQKPLMEGQSFSDVACDAKTGKILIIGSEKTGADDARCRLFLKPGPDQPLMRVLLRHLGSAWIRGADFLPDGSLLFGAEGDLWHGVTGVEPTETPDESHGVITAYRYAPVGERYTYPGTPSQSGVCAIAAGAGHAFVHIKRINGSGWGHLSSLALPAAMTEDRFEAHNSVEDSIRTLQSVKEWQENGSCAYLCASSDRKRVYFTNGMGEERSHFLADSAIESGEPLPLRIGDKILPHD
jgi:WD40 repeat protein